MHGVGFRSWRSPLTSSNTFVASANCGRYCGADVDFVDIDSETGLMSVKALMDKLDVAEHMGTLPKVVVPVHLCGTSCDMSSIAALADRYGFHVLEDASHAIGGSYQGEPVGSCSHSAITVFSFHPVKIITTGEGGLATTNNSHLAQRMAKLRTHGITKDLTCFERIPAGPWSYEQQDLGFNYRMTDIQAALGLSQLKKLDAIVNERNRLFYRYRELLSELPLRLLKIPNDVLSSLHLAVVRLKDNSPEHHRTVFNGLRASGLGVQVHYTPVHLQPYYRSLGFREGDFPEAELYASNAISIPLFPGLQESDLQRVRKNSRAFVDGMTKSPQLCLGTVQFGMPYGITNNVGKVPEAEVCRILSLAASSGIQILDTAHTYGTAEKVLGDCWPNNAPKRLISKLPAAASRQAWESSFYTSLQRLQVSRLDGLLLHRASDLVQPNGIELLRWLESLRDRGLVDRIGVSIYESSDLKQLPLDRLQLVQLPLSIYDQRMINDGTVARLQDMGISVHARSVLLQGLLLQSPLDWPDHLSSAF